MDRRHLKILDEFRSIVEEKGNIMECLEKITNQLSIYIDGIRKRTLGKNHMSKVLSFELDILKAFIDTSHRLEPLLEMKVIEDQIEDAHEEIVTEITPPPVALEGYSRNTEVDPSTFESIQGELCIDEVISTFQRFFQKAKSPTQTSDCDLFLLPERDSDNGNIPLNDIHEIRENLESEKDDTETEMNDSFHTASSASVPSMNQSNGTPTFRDPNVLGTAVAKLNNQPTTSNRCDDILPLELPDVQLKPVTDVLNSSLKTFIVNNLKSGRKKHKKKINTVPNNIEDDAFYEIQNTKLPQLHQMCSFSFIESPSNFYIHLVDEETCYIDRISEDLFKQYRNTPAQYCTKKQASKGIKKFCVVFVENCESWYRGAVLDWRLDMRDDEVLVELVDFGHKHIVSFHYLRKLTREFASMPALAIRCHFPLLYPPDSDRLNRLSKWPEASITALGDLGGLNSQQRNKFFSVCYMDYSAERQSLAIDVFCKEYGETLGQSLLDMGYAVEIQEDEDREQYELEEFLQDVDQLERANNINEAVIGYDPRDEVRICRFTKRDGTCYKGRHCKLEHVPISKDGFTTDKDMVFREAMDTLLLPTPGSFIVLLITHYIDTCHFFAHIVNRPKREKSYMMDEALYDLVERINAPKLLNSYERFSVAPSIGEIVIVRHWTKKWYRGIVRSFNTNDEGDVSDIQVFLVDYGDIVTAKLDELRKINPDYLRLPFQAIECYIDNYKMKDDCSKEAAQEFFNKHMLFKNFVAITRSANLPLKLTLKAYDQSLEIGKSLLANGFAERRTFDPSIDDNCSLKPG